MGHYALAIPIPDDGLHNGFQVTYGTLVDDARKKPVLREGHLVGTVHDAALIERNGTRLLSLSVESALELPVEQPARLYLRWDPDRGIPVVLWVALV